MVLRVDSALLTSVAGTVKTAHDNLQTTRKTAADASVNADGNTGTSASDTAQGNVGAELAEGTMRLENSLMQLAVNLTLAAVAYDKNDFNATVPVPPPPQKPQPYGPNHPPMA